MVRKRRRREGAEAQACAAAHPHRAQLRRTKAREAAEKAARGRLPRKVFLFSADENTVEGALRASQGTIRFGCAESFLPRTRTASAPRACSASGIPRDRTRPSPSAPISRSMPWRGIPRARHVSPACGRGRSACGFGAGGEQAAQRAHQRVYPFRLTCAAPFARSTRLDALGAFRPFCAVLTCLALFARGHHCIPRIRSRRKAMPWTSDITQCFFTSVWK